MMKPFTRENAGEMARRATESRKRRLREQAEAIAAIDANATDDARTRRTKKQLALLDDMIDAALSKGKADLFMRLAATKERLWNLVSPKAGVLKPSRTRGSERRGPVAPVGEAGGEPS